MNLQAKARITQIIAVSILMLGQASAQDVTQADELVKQLELKPESDQHI